MLDVVVLIELVLLSIVVVAGSGDEVVEEVTELGLKVLTVVVVGLRLEVVVVLEVVEELELVEVLVVVLVDLLVLLD